MPPPARAVPWRHGLAQRLGPPWGWISRIAMVLVLALIVVVAVILGELIMFGLAAAIGRSAHAVS